MALVNPHPALKVSVPMNPMVDGWMGDDWFHYGAFRQQNMPYIYDQEATRSSDVKWWTSHFDDYDMYMQAGSAGELGRRRGLEQVGFWRKILEHPSYDAFWRDQAVDQLLAGEPLKVPVMLVASLWDQAQGHPQRHGLPGNGPVESRPGDRRWKYARPLAVRERYRALLPPRDPAALPRPLPQG
jgi:predicted acyl esterase